MNDNKCLEDNSVHDTHLEQKCFLPWSPVGDNSALLKQRYVSYSKSVPRRSKRFVQYRLSQSLNSDVHNHNSSSENISFEEDKHLTRSAKIMRALNFNSSPSYYGKTKTKKSFNVNSTPSPKRFMPVKKTIRKALSLSFGSPLSLSNKVLDFDNDSSDCANNSLTFTSPESIDENQNETPSQQNAKRYKRLHYSTPNAKLNRKSLCSTSFTPLLHSRLKEAIDNIVLITATPNSHSLKYNKGKSKCIDNMTNTSRNLFHEFHDKDDERPHTPENFVHIVPESMSAIKRSHKKERLSRRSERYPTQATSSFTDDIDAAESALNKHKDSFEDADSIDQYLNKTSSSNEISLCNSEDDVSETGSLFNYGQEQKNILLSDPLLSCGTGESKLHEYDIEAKSEENLSENQSSDYKEIVQEVNDIKTNDLSIQDDVLKTEIRPMTPESTSDVILDSQKSITPENHINVLEIIANDSIKKSRKKNKDDNKRKFFSPKILPSKLEPAEQKDEQDESVEEIIVKNEPMHLERACTPEKVNSSRLLLSQFSSIKKSHKKDKHNKILCGFLKRQEYFNKEINFIDDVKPEVFTTDDRLQYGKSMEDLHSDFDITTNFDGSMHSTSLIDENTSSSKLSPSKRKITLDISVNHNTSNVSTDSDLKECDISKEDFKIFTPLKRKRKTFMGSAVKEHLLFYNLPSGETEISEEPVGNISISRCLTPVPNFHDNYVKSDENHFVAIKLDTSDNIEGSEIHDISSNDVTGRLTPRNMSTAELYSNLDSIKKSHRKNKRGNCLRNNMDLIKNNLCDENDQAPQENTENSQYDSSELLNNSIATYDGIKLDLTESFDQSNIEESANSSVDEENLLNANIGNMLQNVTPPNCLKTKNYMKLIRETSIKRSHKKVRDKKKHELSVDTIELSDDGSIFDDEEKLVIAEDQSTN
ncbi:uncharacterized protein LOC143189024 [Calliopsis andreniformis]|uniref:uncharacterized protein LOC143189024 n=1 Tax=Calliopsis andreniformis TaxID=337506 RepID=UPI003FCD3C58